MLRNFIGFVSGVLLSYVLFIGGARLGWLLIVDNVDRTSDKDDLVSVMLWNTFCVPAVSVLVGGIVALIVARSGWWVGGVAVLPLIIYGLIRGAERPEIFFSVVSVILAFAAAFIVSRFKRRRIA